METDGRLDIIPTGMDRQGSDTVPPAFLAGRTGLRVVGDIHGDPAIVEALAEARARNMAVVSLGDITDRGPQSVLALQEVARAERAGNLVMVPGNHDWKFARWAMGNRVSISAGLEETIAGIEAAADAEALKAEFLRLVLTARLWHRIGPFVFVHAALHPSMVTLAPFTLGDRAAAKEHRSLVDLALYGEVTGRADDGLPNRSYGWIDRVPAGITAVVGHDYLADHVVRQVGALGGRTIHLDTGAGKGGRLSWIDIPIDAGARSPRPDVVPPA